MVMKGLAEGKGVTVRRCLKEAGVQSCEPSLSRTRSGEQELHIRPSLWVSQPHMTKPRGSEDTVNEAVVQRKFILLNRVPFGLSPLQ